MRVGHDGELMRQSCRAGNISHVTQHDHIECGSCDMADRHDLKPYASVLLQLHSMLSENEQLLPIQTHAASHRR